MVRGAFGALQSAVLRRPEQHTSSHDSHAVPIVAAHGHALYSPNASPEPGSYRLSASLARPDSRTRANDVSDSRAHRGSGVVNFGVFM